MQRVRVHVPVVRLPAYIPGGIAGLPEDLRGMGAGFGPTWELVQPGESVLVIAGPEDLTPLLAAHRAGPKGHIQCATPDLNWWKTTVAEWQQAPENISLSWVAPTDLRVDKELAEAFLKEHPAAGMAALDTYEAFLADERAQRPLVAEGSGQRIIVSGIVNTLDPTGVTQLLHETFQSLARGGRAYWSVLLADEPVSADGLKQTGARYLPVELEFLAALDAAGFHGMELVWRGAEPLLVIDGIELRPFVIATAKGKQGPCMERGQAVIYRGPFRETCDDDGHHYPRGERVAVCDKTYNVLKREPYAGHFFYLDRYPEITLEEAVPFDCKTPHRRDPKVTKGFKAVSTDGATCSPGSGCC